MDQKSSNILRKTCYVWGKKPCLLAADVHKCRSAASRVGAKPPESPVQMRTGRAFLMFACSSLLSDNTRASFAVNPRACVLCSSSPAGQMFSYSRGSPVSSETATICLAGRCAGSRLDGNRKPRLTPPVHDVFRQRRKRSRPLPRDVQRP